MNEVDTRTLRADIHELLERGEGARARARLAQLWSAAPGPMTAGFVNSCAARLRAITPLTPFKLAILRSYTVEPMVPLLRAAALGHGVDLTVHVGAFNAYQQEFLDERSELYACAPDAVLLAVATPEIAADLWRDFAGMSAAASTAAVKRTGDALEQCVSRFRSLSDAHVVLHTLESPVFVQAGLLDAQTAGGQRAAVQAVNDRIAHIARTHTGVYVLDYAALVARHGALRWRDERKYLTVRMPVSAEHLNDFVAEWTRILIPLAGRTCKVLVVDLDNTMWGGTLGEDGAAGLQLGTEYPGAIFQDIQRAVRDLYHRGILLAVCSKNNAPDAMDVLRTHPGMVLRPEHFAAFRINWQDKAQNLREIAAELNVGLDSLAFIDDNPAERQQVRLAAPEVTVFELPADPAGYAVALRGSAVFERLTLSEEDRGRGRYYAEQRERATLESSAATLEDYYRSLEMVADIRAVAKDTIARTSQLTMKTNQFNLTTRRYSEQQIERFAAASDWHVYTIRLNDRFGDNGIVGVAIVHDDQRTCVIDSFLLSCRVIGRTVETAFLATLMEDARARRAVRIEGRFIPTKKNAPARDFYAQHDFVKIADDDEGSLWAFDLTTGTIQRPEWIGRRMAERGMAL